MKIVSTRQSLELFTSFILAQTHATLVVIIFLLILAVKHALGINDGGKRGNDGCRYALFLDLANSFTQLKESLLRWCIRSIQ